MQNHQSHNQHDTARTAPGTSGQYDNSTAGQLAHLSEMDDFEIADGEPDIQGWDVRTLNGEKIGDVEDLIVDTALMKVRYIEVKLSDDFGNRNDRNSGLGSDRGMSANHGIGNNRGVSDETSDRNVRGHDSGNADDRYTLIPIGSARLDDDKDDVLINLHDGQLQSLPDYERGSLTREYESQLLNGFTRSDANRSQADDQRSFYDGEHFDERTAFEGRRGADRREESYLRRRDH